jgi:hypothetical protein
MLDSPEKFYVPSVAVIKAEILSFRENDFLRFRTIE